MPYSRLLFFSWLILFCSSAAAQVTPPNYEECRLDAIFPAGGKQGETVSVQLIGGRGGGMNGARRLIIDGPPGVTARDVVNKDAMTVTATLEIAPDALPGMRCVRVLNERTGLTNMVYFSVGRLPEIVEKEPNDALLEAQPVEIPIVVNGIVSRDAEVDSFKFKLAAGQRLTAAVLAYAIDSHGQYKNFGITDANLQIVDERGRIVAEAGDTLGLDPALEFTSPAAGEFTARVSLEAYQGFPQAVYRLVLGDLPLATSMFPAGGERGSTVEVELAGFGIPAGTRQQVTIPVDDHLPLQQVLPAGSSFVDLPLPFLRGNLPEGVEIEPNDKQEQAPPVELGTTLNGRIGAQGDADWYRVKLATKQVLCAEIAAQRFLRSPVDSLIEIYDAAGQKVATNDDGFALDYISMHDFRPLDGRATFTAPSDGEYFVRVSDQSGSYGPRAVYRLTIKEAHPDFELYQHPDAVPVWGPGTTAGVLIKVVRWDNMNDEVVLTVEGLPAGWTASTGTSRSYNSQPRQDPVLYQLLTITAPADAKICDHAEFRVVGRGTSNGKTIERVAMPLTLYYTSDTGFFRITPVGRAVVAQPQTPWLSTTTSTFTVEPLGTFIVPVEVHSANPLDTLDLTADLATSGVATALSPPQAIAVKDGVALLPIKLADHIKPGQYDITVGLRWRSDIRIGMPGPCTPLIKLNVVAPAVP
jgi:hypothetical protein